MSLFSERGPEDYFYTLNGRNSVTALVDQHSRLVEAYNYDVFDQPALSVQNGQETNQSILSSTVKNHLLAGSQLYDIEAGVSVIGSSSYDPKTAQTLNEQDVLLGPVQVDPPVSKPDIPWTLDPYSVPGGMSGPVVHDYGVEPAFGPDSPDYGIWLVFNGIAIVGVGYAIFRATPLSFLGTGYFGSLVRSTVRSGIAYSLREAGGEGSDGGGNSKEGSGGGSGHGGSGGSGGGIEIGGRGGIGGGSGSGGGADGDSSGDSSSPDDSGPSNPTPRPEMGGDYTFSPDGGLKFEGGSPLPGGGFGSGGGSGSGGGFGSGGFGCFIAGTPVALSDGTTKPIETVAAGDFVTSRDETTGNTTAQRVSRTWIHKVKATLLLHLTNGEKVETTKEHRFSVADQGFVGAGRLAPGATLNTQSEQSVKVTGIEPQERSTTVYNLEVENFHTYFVGKDGVWVHNLKDDEGKGGDDDWGPDGP